MTALCTLALAALAILTGALIIEDKSPRQLILSLVREAEKGLRRAGLVIPSLRLWVMEHDPKRVSPCSPFARLDKTPDHHPIHYPILLNIPTSDGTGEAAHPDVLYAPGGWGAGGWPWLMAATPYPLGMDYYENPEFYVSRDGLRWAAPQGLANPLDRAPLRPRGGARSEFHSDPSLLMTDEGALFYYYRRTAVFRNETENMILLRTTRDGVHWTEPEAVLTERRRTGEDRKFLSPSALFLNGEYVLWTVEYEGEGRGTRERHIVRRTSPDGVHWGEPTRAQIDAPFPMRPPWHLDVVFDRVAGADGGRLLMALTTAAERGYEAELYLMQSDGNDGGLTWGALETGPAKPFEPAYRFEARRIYRSSLVPLPSGGARLYYSALSADGTWGVAVAELLEGRRQRRGA